MIVMTEVYDKPKSEMDEMLRSLFPAPKPLDAQHCPTCGQPLPIVKCDKCGATSDKYQVYSPTYGVGTIPHLICLACDSKLFALLDGLPGGVPESGYHPNSMEYLYASLIYDAFFSK